jgi:type IV pilus assembly protein PilN
MLGAAALGAVLLSFLIVNYYSRQIDGENTRIGFIKDQIATVDQQIKEIEDLDKKKAKLLARKEVIEQLQANRSQMVHLFDSLVRTIPDGVALTSLKQDGDKLTLEGRSQSNARVSTYMRNLEGAGWMTKPELSIIEAKDGGDPGLPYSFNLTVTLANPNAPKDSDGDGVPDQPAEATPPAAPASVANPAPAVPASTAPAVAPAPATNAAPAAGGAAP